MIVESFYKTMKTVILWFFGLFPDIDVSFLDTWHYIKDILIDILTGIGCLIPFGSLFPLLYSTISLWLFRLVFAILIRIKSFLPFWGGS